jgi:hypothetical protein
VLTGLKKRLPGARICRAGSKANEAGPFFFPPLRRGGKKARPLPRWRIENAANTRAVRGQLFIIPSVQVF